MDNFTHMVDCVLFSLKVPISECEYLPNNVIITSMVFAGCRRSEPNFLLLRLINA